MPTPLVIGSSAIGRIESIGTDATSLVPGQLVLIDCYIRGRDNPMNVILSGYTYGALDGGKKLMEGEWRDGSYAEYAKIPLENCFVLDEKRLLGEPDQGGLGYQQADLARIFFHAIAYGGLRDLDIQAGNTVIVAPATGSFGGAAVPVAAAMGARVIAAGRNVDALKKIAATSPGRVEIAQLKTDDVKADLQTLQKFGQIDAFIDFSPNAAAKSTHIESCLMALKPYGKASLMGGIHAHVPIPYFHVMFNNLQLRGKFMYERSDVLGLIKLYERGLLKLGAAGGYKSPLVFPLEDWSKAFDEAEKSGGFDPQVLMQS